MLGLRSSTTKSHLAKATFKSVAFSIASALEMLEQAVNIANEYEIVLIGGGAEFEPFKEIFSSLLYKTVKYCDLKSPPATGACVLAAAGLTGATPEDIASRWELKRNAEKLNPKIDRDYLVQDFKRYRYYLKTLKDHIF